MRIMITRRSCEWRERVTRWRLSIRSSRRVISGSCVIMRQAACPQVRPSAPAPRRIRRILYCVPEMPKGFINLSTHCSIASAVRRSAIDAASSRDLPGLTAFCRKPLPREGSRSVASLSPSERCPLLLIVVTLVVITIVVKRKFRKKTGVKGKGSVPASWASIISMASVAILLEAVIFSRVNH